MPARSVKVHLAPPNSDDGSKFFHKDPSGQWEEYSEELTAVIAAAITLTPTGGQVALPGI